MKANVVSCVVAGLLGNSGFSADVPESWKVVPFNGRDFSGLSQGVSIDDPTFGTVMRAHDSLSSMILDAGFEPHQAEDGTFFFDTKMWPVGQGKTYERPFILRTNPRPCHPRLYYNLDKLRYGADLKAWLEDHPGFVACLSHEWANDPRNIDFANYADPSWKKEAITTNQEAEARAEFVRAKQGTREEYTFTFLKKWYDACIHGMFGDPKRAILGDGMWCVGHLAAYWGAGGLSIETTRDYNFYQVMMMFNRGAARQFRIPWHWFVASYLDGTDFLGRKISGTRMAERKVRGHGAQYNWTGCEIWGPEFGISFSALRRTTYMTWLSGASSYQREAFDRTHFLTNPPRLSDEGEMYDAFWKLTQKHDRGMPWTPFALLVPAARGYSRKGGHAYRTFPYTHPDAMLDAVISTVLDYPRNNRAENEQRRIERVMANSPYGDVFDVLTPDFPDSSAFERTIGDYPCAFLIGAYKPHPQMERILRDYVRKGGILVLNAAQLTEAYPESLTGIRLGAETKDGDETFYDLTPTTAEVIRRDAKGRVVFTENRFGSGRVIVAAEKWLTPWFGDEPQSARYKAMAMTWLGEPRRFPEVEWLLSRLGDELLPFRVKGDIQYGINRTKDGWLVYLINNAGVVKYAEKPEIRFPGGSTVTVEARKGRMGTVRELSSEECAPRVSENACTLTVPFGDLRILKIADR